MSIIKMDSEDIAEIKNKLTVIILNAGFVASKKKLGFMEILKDLFLHKKRKMVINAMEVIKEQVLRIEELLPKVKFEKIDWLKRRRKKVKARGK